MNRTQALGNVHEHRFIKVSSKRQFTIPKAFYDRLEIGETETLEAFLMDDGLLLKPVKSEPVYERDIQNIVRKVREEGYTGDEMDKEIAYRLAKYQRMFERRIQGFLNDMDGSLGSDDEGDVDLNGLEAFFDSEDGESIEGDSKER